jgi:hypothetical protein
MRTKLIFGLLLAIGLAVMVRATVYSPVGSSVAVNNTTSTFTTNTFGNYNFPFINYTITSTGGLSTNTQETVNFQFSLDNVNWTTVATYHPSSTNAVTDYWSPATAQQNIYQRLQVVTTTNVSLNIVGQY